MPPVSRPVPPVRPGPAATSAPQQPAEATGLPPGGVLVVGAGLVGTSVALALARRGVVVRVTDTDPLHQAVALSRLPASAGSPKNAEPGVVVVATPPDDLGGAIAAALTAYPSAIVTDVGSVKGHPLAYVVARSRAARAGTGGGLDVTRYVGSHPMAGSERSGPLAAAADLFDGRTWAVTPHDGSADRAIATVEALATACGAVVVHMGPHEHDEAVARTSHLPHLMAALTAGRLYGAPLAQLALSGQGVRDVTRIAAGNPTMWRQIIGANASALRGLLGEVRRDVDDLLAALDGGDLAVVERLLAQGATAAVTIPGRHGGPAERLAAVTVTVPDRTGALAELFDVVGALGVNIEDVRIDHDPARQFGLVEIDVSEAACAALAASLRARGWVAHR